MPKLKQDLAVELIDIYKSFGTNIANNNINLAIKKGSIHAIMGENGAGKTVLMSILQGIIPADNGGIKINGHWADITDTHVANQYGIGMVSQNPQLVEYMPVWKNIIFGAEQTSLGFIKKKPILNKLTDLCRIYKFKLNLKANISTLTATEKQQCAILKLMYRHCNILIFDEPTSILSDAGIENLMKIILRLKKEGKTILFISHKIKEIMHICNSATVLRQGQVVADYDDIKKIPIPQIMNDMFGEAKIKKLTRKKIDHKKTLLKIANLKIADINNHKNMMLKGINLNVRAGEIVGIAGINNNGQRELINAIMGLQKVAKGEIVFKDNIINKKTTQWRMSNGIAFVPESRNEEGLVLDMLVKENAILSSINFHPFNMYGLINFNKMQSRTIYLINKWELKGVDNGYQVMRALSGGNQQRLLVGRELARQHDILVIAQPTQGVDKKSCDFISKQIIIERNKNRGILLISYDLKEIMDLADRILVLGEGRIIKEFETKNTIYKQVSEAIAFNKKV